jgi:hypothetical protein
MWIKESFSCVFVLIVCCETVFFIADVAIEDRNINMDVCVNAKVKIEIPDEDFEGKLNCFDSPYCYIMCMVLDCDM